MPRLRQTHSNPVAHHRLEAEFQIGRGPDALYHARRWSKAEIRRFMTQTRVTLMLKVAKEKGRWAPTTKRGGMR